MGKSKKEDIGLRIEQLNTKIQELTNEINENEPDPENLPPFRLPYHMVNSQGTFRSNKKFISDIIIRKNLTSHLIFSDYLRWSITRTTAYGKLKEMLIKYYIVNLQVIARTLIFAVSENTKEIIPALHQLAEKDIISQETFKEIQWFNDFGKEVEMDYLDRKEYGKYTMDQYHRAGEAVQKLFKDLEMLKYK